jgi:multidrug efflux pump
MRISDLSIRRPVFATVVSLLLIAFGLLAMERLPLQEYPAIDPPIVSIETNYPGASASVVETRITQLLEDRIAGIEGIVSIESSSADGESEIDVEFSLDRDIDGAANDIRDRISSVADNLPDQAEPPEIEKSDSSDDVIIWLSLSGEGYTIPELTDYANRYLVDRFSTQNGVARVRLSGGKEYAMRVWLDRNALAARQLTVDDVADALESENVELPAGFLESRDRQFTLRIPRSFTTAADFQNLVVARGNDGYLVRLADVARVEVGSVEERSLYRGNEVPMVGLGMIKQSTASVLEVANGAKSEMARLQSTLPDGMQLSLNFDSSVFVSGALHEVVSTLFIAMGLVVVVIFVFLGNIRTTLVPAVTVPISLIGTFIFLALFGFTLNLLTLLALVLAIGLVVDDAIVVIENVHRRMVVHGETPLVAAFRGTRQIGFAVIATTLVLITVFIPLSLLQGDIGRLFSEFALTLAASVGLSCLVALSLAPMLCSKLLSPRMHESRISHGVHWLLDRSQMFYRQALLWALRWRWIVVGLFALVLALTAWLFQQLPNEYTPQEDRGAFFVLIEGPPGATFHYMQDYYDEIEARLMTLVDAGDINQVSVRGPRGFGNVENFNDGMAVVTLNDWGDRRSAWDILADVRSRLSDLPGVTATPVMRQGFGGRVEKPIQFVIGGSTYEQLADWRDRLLTRIRSDDSSGLEAVDSDYKETQPQLRIQIDYNRAAALGVTVSTIGNTLETLFGGRNVTTYVDGGEEYDVILEGERDNQRAPSSLDNVQVRSAVSDDLPAHPGHRRGLPGAGCPVRKLRAPAGHHAHGTDGHQRRLAGPMGQRAVPQYLQSGGAGHAGRSGRQERYPDRRIRQPVARRRSGFLRRAGRGFRDSSQADPDDDRHHHGRRRSPDSGLRPWCRIAHRHWYRHLLWRCRRDPADAIHRTGGLRHASAAYRFTRRRQPASRTRNTRLRDTRRRNQSMRFGYHTSLARNGIATTLRQPCCCNGAIA